MCKKYSLKFPSEVVNQKIIYNLIKRYGIRINILKAKINADEEGILVAELESESGNFHLATIYLKSLGITLEQI